MSEHEQKSSQRAAWDEHNLSQLRYFRSLSLRSKMEAMEGMARLVRRFQQMRDGGAFHRRSKDSTDSSANLSKGTDSIARRKSERLQQEIIEGCREMANVYLEIEREYHPLEEEVQRALDKLPKTRRNRSRTSGSRRRV